MSLFDLAFQDGRRWIKLADRYAVTKKPRGIDFRGLDAVPFFTMDALPHSGPYDPARCILKSPSELTTGTYFERGDVLVAKITPSFENGKQALVRGIEMPFAYATTEVIALHPLDRAHDIRLLFFYLLHPEVRHHVAERMEGSTGRQRVPESVLLDLPMPEFDAEDETRAADGLELIQKTIQIEEASADASEDAKAAAMANLFTRGLRGEQQKEGEIGAIPASWRVDPIGAHHSVMSGGTPSRSNAAYWTGGTVPWVKTTEVNYSVINETEEHISLAGLDGSAAKILPAGTLLMAMYGQGVTRGRVALLGIDASCNQACAAIAANDEVISSRYLYQFLTWRYDAIRSLAHGGQQQNLNLDIVREILVAHPSDPQEQREIVEILEALDRKVDLHRRKRDVLEALFRSLLHKLMTGEISVDQLDATALQAPKGTAA